MWNLFGDFKYPPGTYYRVESKLYNPCWFKNVVAAAIKGGTDAVVLCHNHPNGVALPSLEDMDATGSIARALGLVNVHLLDHFILTDTEYFSMRDANRLPIYDFTMMV